jgi:hypothetical protein
MAMAKAGLAWDVVAIDREQQRAKAAPSPRPTVGGASA